MTASAPFTLILLRHGESEWNAKNLFTGWVDVDLTDKGRAEALRGGQQLKAADLLPDVVHTSYEVCTTSGSRSAAFSCWPPRRASARPLSVRSTSTQPVKRFLAFHSLSPWRRSMSVKGAEAVMPTSLFAHPDRARAGVGRPRG